MLLGKAILPVSIVMAAAFAYAAYRAVRPGRGHQIDIGRMGVAVAAMACSTTLLLMGIIEYDHLAAAAVGIAKPQPTANTPAEGSTLPVPPPTPRMSDVHEGLPTGNGENHRPDLKVEGPKETKQQQSPPAKASPVPDENRGAIPADLKAQPALLAATPAPTPPARTPLATDTHGNFLAEVMELQIKSPKIHVEVLVHNNSAERLYIADAQDDNQQLMYVAGKRLSFDRVNIPECGNRLGTCLEDSNQTEINRLSVIEPGKVRVVMMTYFITGALPEQGDVVFGLPLIMRTGPADAPGAFSAPKPLVFNFSDIPVSAVTAAQ
jgi:hypothetical protein